MRQIFTSPRLETVEGVAKLLNDQGIETWISEGRSYKGARRREFSFRDRFNAPQPAVWIVKAEDQTPARKLLREAGLIETTRSTESYVPEPLQAKVPKAGSNAVALRVKLVLLAAIVMGALLILQRIF